jgi:hypothetical protein
MLQVQLNYTAAAKERRMSPPHYLSRIRIFAGPRHWSACLALGTSAVVGVLGTLEGARVESNPNRAEESGSSITPDMTETRWKILRIVPPENIQELGTVIFGESESLLEPFALRGPR